MAWAGAQPSSHPGEPEPPSLPLAHQEAPRQRLGGCLLPPWESWGRSEGIPGLQRKKKIHWLSPQLVAALQLATGTSLLWQARAYCSRTGHRRAVRLSSLHMSKRQLLPREEKQRARRKGRAAGQHCPGRGLSRAGKEGGAPAWGEEEAKGRRGREGPHPDLEEVLGCRPGSQEGGAGQKEGEG